MNVKPIVITDPTEAARVLALQRVSYPLEAKLLGRDDIPPLHETIADLRSCGETFFGSFVGATLAGAIAYTVVADTLDLHRVMVRPQYLRRGIASALIAFAEAREQQTLRTIVATGSGNIPARCLYRRHGFRETGEREVAPGLTIVEFERLRA